LWGKLDPKKSACPHIFPALRTPTPCVQLRSLKKTSCHGACGVTLAFRERSLGPELNADFVVAKMLALNQEAMHQLHQAISSFSRFKNPLVLVKFPAGIQGLPDQKRHEHPAKSNI